MGYVAADSPYWQSLPGPGLEIIRNPRLRTHLSPLVVVRNPNRQSPTRTPDHMNKSDMQRLRDKLFRMAGRPLRNLIQSPVLTPSEAEEILGLDAEGIRQGMANGRYCVTTVTQDGTKRTGVRISELLGHRAAWVMSAWR